MTYPSNTASSQEAQRSSRRRFFKVAGGGLAGAAALSVAGCDSGGPREETEVVLDFSNDVGVLNYAYALEQLEARFYERVAETIASEELTFGGDMGAVTADYFVDVTAHEAIHRDFLRAALGGQAIIDLEFDFSSVDFTDPEKVLRTAQVLEDTGVSAYNGAGRFIQDVNNLALAGKIVSVEARHAASIRALISPDTGSFANLSDIGRGANSADGRDAAQTPAQVLAAAGAFITTPITLRNVG